MKGWMAIGILAALGTAGCAEKAAPVASILPQAPAPVASSSPDFGPVLGADGHCTGSPPTTAAAIEPGIAECDLVRIKGKPPTDVLIGESGKGQREVQVLYAEPGAREIYLFVDNKLDRILK